jgi:hypothetical protein
MYMKEYFGSILGTICVSQTTTAFVQQSSCGSTSDLIKSKVDSRNIKTWNLKKQITARYEVQVYHATYWRPLKVSVTVEQLSSHSAFPQANNWIGQLWTDKRSLPISFTIRFFLFCVIKLLSVHYLPQCVNFRNVQNDLFYFDTCRSFRHINPAV